MYGTILRFGDDAYFIFMNMGGKGGGGREHVALVCFEPRSSALLFVELWLFALLFIVGEGGREGGRMLF